MFVSAMDNIFVSEANNNNPGATPSLHPPPNNSIDLGSFDLDEALASAAHSCCRFAQCQSLVATLPAAQHTDTADAVCSVCMESFDSDGNKQIPCGHVYHSGCITAWISRSNSRPLCRSDIFLHSP